MDRPDYDNSRTDYDNDTLSGVSGRGDREIEFSSRVMADIVANLSSIRVDNSDPQKCETPSVSNKPGKADSISSTAKPYPILGTMDIETILKLLTKRDDNVSKLDNIRRPDSGVHSSDVSCGVGATKAEEGDSQKAGEYLDRLVASSQGDRAEQQVLKSLNEALAKNDFAAFSVEIGSLRGAPNNLQGNVFKQVSAEMEKLGVPCKVEWGPLQHPSLVLGEGTQQIRFDRFGKCEVVHSYSSFNAASCFDGLAKEVVVKAAAIERVIESRPTQAGDARAPLKIGSNHHYSLWKSFEKGNTL